MREKNSSRAFLHADGSSDLVAHNVNVVELLLLAAGDIEINPGPVHPGNVCA